MNLFYYFCVYVIMLELLSTKIMEWLKNNILQLITIILLSVILWQQSKMGTVLTAVRSVTEEAKSEASFTNSKLDYVESEINEGNRK